MHNKLSNALKKNQDIEVLRAFAIMFVLFHHLGREILGADIFLSLESKMSFWSGVDLFFCISGFVITRSFAAYISPQQEPSLKDILSFWGRRIFRLWPSVWFWVTAYLVLSTQFNDSGIFGNPLANLDGSIAAILNFANYYWFQCNLHDAKACGGDPVYWSLSLEEQFYLVFPFIFLIPARSRGFVLIGLVVLQMGLSRPNWSTVWISYFRTDAVILGVLIAHFSCSSGYRVLLDWAIARRRLVGILALAALPLLAYCSASQFTPSRDGWEPYSIGLVALVSALLVLIASANLDAIVPGRYLRQLLLWIGSRSFAIYLVHRSAAFISTELAFRTSQNEWFSRVEGKLALVAFAAILLFVLAEFNYRIIEVPLRDFGRKLLRRNANGPLSNGSLRSP